MHTTCHFRCCSPLCSSQWLCTNSTELLNSRSACPLRLKVDWHALLLGAWLMLWRHNMKQLLSLPSFTYFGNIFERGSNTVWALLHVISVLMPWMSLPCCHTFGACCRQEREVMIYLWLHIQQGFYYRTLETLQIKWLWGLNTKQEYDVSNSSEKRSMKGNW